MRFGKADRPPDDIIAYVLHAWIRIAAYHLKISDDLDSKATQVFN